MHWGRGDNIYEAFAQFGSGKDIEHVGSVRAADAELAWHAAKEAYTRREKCSLLWVVPRTSILVSDPSDEEVLLSGWDRMEHRGPAYPSAHRRARKERKQAQAQSGS